MVVDTIAQRYHYTSLHPGFPRAFDFLVSEKWAQLISPIADERRSVRHEIDGDRMHVSIDSTEGRGRDGARLEAHRRHIDIQLTLDGHEEIGWKPLADCRQVAVPFDPSRDITFFSDRPETWLSLPAGHFAIFFPGDAHAPLAGCGALRKAIVKIAVD